MNRLRVLVVSTGSTTAACVADRLGDSIELSVARPGPGLIRTVRERRPELAVLDAIHERPGSAALEVALLKEYSPGVQIVAVSGASSELDGDVIEQGVFCYLAGRSVDELLRVVERAVRERHPAETTARTLTQPRSLS